MKYILIYVYNSLSDDELSYWEDLAKKFKEIGYELFFLFQRRPNREVKVAYDTFIERLDDVQFPISTKTKVNNQKLNHTK